MLFYKDKDRKYKNIHINHQGKRVDSNVVKTK